MGWNHQLEELQNISKKETDYQIIWMLDMKNVCTNLLIYEMEKGGFCLTKDILNLLTFLFCQKIKGWGHTGTIKEPIIHMAKHFLTLNGCMI